MLTRGLVAAPAVALLILVGLGLRGSHTPASSGHSEAGLTVPPGFEVERVAGPPLVDRPIVADFDDEGRLYVGDSSGSNDKVEQQLADRPHRIVRLEDTDGDGRFDRSVVFADRMMLPQGAMWLDGSLYVAAPPSIWKLTDTDGDGVADEREEWFRGHTLTGCANDLHGPYLGPDGWIYWTKGAFAQQTHDVAGESPLVTRAAHIFRRRPGSDTVEVVMTGGMDNPVDVAFTSTGERILSATFVEHPQHGRRDALLHAIYGGVYGKPHAVLDGHPRTGDLMPVLAHLGPAVPAGLTRYSARVFGDEYRDTFFAAMFNLHKVTRMVLEPSGATFDARTSDFLVSASRDFHPTDVIEDADGSLLVIDTGPWYKLCCPTSQLAKPDLPGAIYRVRRTNARRPRDARGSRVPWQELSSRDLASLLDDGRPAVRQRAVGEIGRRGEEAVPALRQVLASLRTAEAGQNAVWALARIESASARGAVRLAIQDRSDGVRHAAAHVAGLWRDKEAVPPLLDLLRSGPPPLQRAAAEALGRIGDSRAVPSLLESAGSSSDRVLEHSSMYAVIDIADAGVTAAAERNARSAGVRRAALIALDGIPGAGLEARSIVPLLDTADPLLRDTAWWIAARHPEWGDALAGFFEQRLGDARAEDGDVSELAQMLAQFSGAPAIQSLLGRTVVGPATPWGRDAALQAMSLSRLKELPSSWAASLRAVLTGGDPDAARHAVGTVRALPASAGAAPGLRPALLALARDPARPDDLRLGALAAIRGGGIGLDTNLFEFVISHLQPESPAALRPVAAGVLEKATLAPRQLIALADVLEHAGPLELGRLLPAFDSASDEAAGLAMVAALERSPVRTSLRPDMIRARLAKYPDAVRRRGEAMLASLDSDLAGDAGRLDTLLASLPGGDVRHGQAVFNSDRAACLSCHTIGYLGGTIGPDLTRIGEVRTERDLLEAIVFPSASFVRSYEPVVVVTRSGARHHGRLREEDADEVTLVTAAGEEVRIARAEVADMQAGTVSLMPAGLDAQLTREELADLLAFLKGTRWGAN